MSGKVAVLFLSHVWNRVAWSRFERLRREIGERAEVFLALDKSGGVGPALRRLRVPHGSLLLFDANSLEERLGYACFKPGKIVPGSGHYPALAFVRLRSDVERVVMVEYDVEFAGHWGDFLDAVLASGPDFASLHFRTYADRPEFHFWPSVEPSDADREWASDTANLRRSFNPVYVVSREALGLIDRAHKAGWHAHYEILLATILARENARLVDLAELGFCLGTVQDPLPDVSDDERATVRWRPPVGTDEFERRSTGATLFHPVKDPWFYDGARIVRVADDDAG